MDYKARQQGHNSTTITSPSPSPTPQQGSDSKANPSTLSQQQVQRSLTAASIPSSSTTPAHSSNNSQTTMLEFGFNNTLGENERARKQSVRFTDDGGIEAWRDRPILPKLEVRRHDAVTGAAAHVGPNFLLWEVITDTSAGVSNHVPATTAPPVYRCNRCNHQPHVLGFRSVEKSGKVIEYGRGVEGLLDPTKAVGALYSTLKNKPEAFVLPRPGPSTKSDAAHEVYSVVRYGSLDRSGRCPVLAFFTCNSHFHNQSRFKLRCQLVELSADESTIVAVESVESMPIKVVSKFLKNKSTSSATSVTSASSTPASTRGSAAGGGNGSGSGGGGGGGGGGRSSRRRASSKSRGKAPSGSGSSASAPAPAPVEDNSGGGRSLRRKRKFSEHVALVCSNQDTSGNGNGNGNDNTVSNVNSHNSYSTEFGSLLYNNSDAGVVESTDRKPCVSIDIPMSDSHLSYPFPQLAGVTEHGAQSAEDDTFAAGVGVGTPYNDDDMMHVDPRTVFCSSSNCSCNGNGRAQSQCENDSCSANKQQQQQQQPTSPTRAKSPARQRSRRNGTTPGALVPAAILGDIELSDVAAVGGSFPPAVYDPSDYGFPAYEDCAGQDSPGDGQVVPSSVLGGGAGGGADVDGSFQSLELLGSFVLNSPVGGSGSVIGGTAAVGLIGDTAMTDAGANSAKTPTMAQFLSQLDAEIALSSKAISETNNADGDASLNSPLTPTLLTSGLGLTGLGEDSKAGSVAGSVVQGFSGPTTSSSYVAGTGGVAGSVAGSAVGSAVDAPAAISPTGQQERDAELLLAAAFSRLSVNGQRRVLRDIHNNSGGAWAVVKDFVETQHEEEDQ